MPSSPQRPCAEPGCGVLVKEGRCPTHKRAEYRAEDARRGSRQARGYGRAWEKIRVYILRRDHHLCQVCRQATATEVDHIIEKADGGEDTPENLQAICSPCHATKTGRSEAARRSGAAGATVTQGGRFSCQLGTQGPRPSLFFTANRATLLHL